MVHLLLWIIIMNHIMKCITEYKNDMHCNIYKQTYCHIFLYLWKAAIIYVLYNIF